MSDRSRGKHDSCCARRTTIVTDTCIEQNLIEPFMDDTGTFFWGLMFGAIGFGYLIYGKNQGNAFMLSLGILLCVFPYFISSSFWTLIIGGFLTLAPLLKK